MLGFRDLAEHLIAEHPEHVNARGGNEVTPIHVAARRGHADILLLLLEHGADLEDRGSCGMTPLHLTSFQGNIEAGRCLLDRGADIHARDDTEWTPLFSAAVEEQVEFARMLLERGANINAHDGRRRTPLHWAVKGEDNIQVVRLLLEHGADANARDDSGNTPSPLKSAVGANEIVRLLYENGAESVKLGSTYAAESAERLDEYSAEALFRSRFGTFGYAIEQPELLFGFGDESVELLSEYYATHPVESLSEDGAESVL
jgi:cytohesin